MLTTRSCVPFSATCRGLCWPLELAAANTISRRCVFRSVYDIGMPTFNVKTGLCAMTKQSAERGAVPLELRVGLKMTAPSSEFPASCSVAVVPSLSHRHRVHTLAQALPSLWIHFHKHFHCHHRIPSCPRTVYCAVTLVVCGLHLLQQPVCEAVRQLGRVATLHLFQVISAQQWNSTGKLVADTAVMQIEDDEGDQSNGSLAPTSPLSFVITNTGSSKMDTFSTMETAWSQCAELSVSCFWKSSASVQTSSPRSHRNGRCPECSSNTGKHDCGPFED